MFCKERRRNEEGKKERRRREEGEIAVLKRAE
jgi:hypothetical protein